MGKNTNKILVFVIDDSLGMGGGVWWGSVVVQNLPSERQIAYGEGAKKTNNTAFSATHTYIKLVFAYFFLCTFPLVQFERDIKTQTKKRHLVRAGGYSTEIHYLYIISKTES